MTLSPRWAAGCPKPPSPCEGAALGPRPLGFRFGISLHPWDGKGGVREQGKPGRAPLQGWDTLTALAGTLRGTGSLTAPRTRPAAPVHW